MTSRIRNNLRSWLAPRVLNCPALEVRQHVGPRCRYPFSTLYFLSFHIQKSSTSPHSRRRTYHGRDHGFPIRKIRRSPADHDQNMYYMVMNRFVGNSPHRYPVAPVISCSLPSGTSSSCAPSACALCLVAR